MFGYLMMFKLMVGSKRFPKGEFPQFWGYNKG